MCYWGDFCWWVFLFLCCCSFAAFTTPCLQWARVLEHYVFSQLLGINSVWSKLNGSFLTLPWSQANSKYDVFIPNCQVLDSGLQVSFSLGQDLTKWLLYLVDGIPSLEFLWIVIIVLSVLGCFWNRWRGYNYCFVEVATELDGFEVLDEEDFLLVRCSISFQTSWDVVIHLFWTMWISCPCLQIWRLLTNFIFLGPFSMQFGVRILMM
jgi:hypothetical protein